jgi:UDP-glucose 4-epimerase
LAKLRAGETVRIFNPDGAFNNVVHVQDLAAFVSHVLAAPPSGFNAVPVASRDPIRVREVIDTLATGAGVTARVEEVKAVKPGFTVGIAAAGAVGFAPRSTVDALAAFARERGW